ncbi:MAG: cytochrome c [Chloroflexi bacterium]|nr:cytochrome c [Chloroflexota bacterium]
MIVGLFALGAAALVGALPAPNNPYKVPADPTIAAIMVGSLVGVLILTVATGGGLAFAFNMLGGMVTKEKPGAPGRADTGGASKVAPYVPSYSYKPVPENVELRRWLVVSVISLAFLVAIVVFGSGGVYFIETVRKFDTTMWAVTVGGVVGVIVLTIAVGAGLSFWFYRTAEEKAKAAAAGPMWPSTQMQMLEEKMKSPGSLIPEMTFLNKLLIGADVLLALVILGVIVAWVVPGMFQVAAVDQSMKPTAAPAAAQPVVAAVGPSDALKKEFADLPKGNAATGQQLFNTLTPPCATCHTVTGDQIIVGPAMAGVATRAATRKQGFSAEIYFYESITSPGAYLVPGFADGLMPKTFKETLKPQEISDLIAYLATLK